MNQGGKLAGGNPARGRMENDFYATNPLSTKALLEVENFIGNIYEPACGEGHISKILEEYGYKVYSSDLIDRGYGQSNTDFLSENNAKWSGVDNVVTNPPFNLFQEFAEHALKLATDKVILFGKLQALEGKKRATFMQNSPLKTVYVFKSRQNPLRNGSPVDEKGKPWASTMAFAWFVWEKGYTGEPTIKWLD